MKNQVLFSLKDKSKKLKCRLLQFLFGALRVNICTANSTIFSFCTLGLNPNSTIFGHGTISLKLKRSVCYIRVIFTESVCRMANNGHPDWSSLVRTGFT